MKLPKKGTNELSKDGFDWITLKVIFQGPKGLKRVKFGCFATLANFLKSCLITFLYFILNVIFKVGKVRFGPFSHNYSVVKKCCPNVLHHVASLLWNQSCPKIWKLWNHSKGPFQGSERSNLDLCDLFQLISKKRYIVGSNFVWNTYSKSYMDVIHKRSMLCLKFIRNTQ